MKNYWIEGFDFFRNEWFEYKYQYIIIFSQMKNTKINWIKSFQLFKLS